MKTAGIIVTLAILVAPMIASSQNADPTVDVEIYVQAGSPCMAVRFARVSIPELGRSTSTDSVGYAAFVGLPAGQHRVVVESVGAGRIARSIVLAIGRGPVVLIADLATSEIFATRRAARLRSGE